jgi:hypothetical protein
MAKSPYNVDIRGGTTTYAANSDPYNSWGAANTTTYKTADAPTPSKKAAAAPQNKKKPGVKTYDPKAIESHVQEQVKYQNLTPKQADEERKYLTKNGVELNGKPVVAPPKPKSLLSKVGHVVKDVASAATQGEQKFSQGIARTLPGGSADLDAQRQSSEANQKALTIYSKLHKSGKMNDTQYKKHVDAIAKESNKTSAELTKTTKAMPTKTQIALGAASTAADIVTAGSLPAIKGAMTAGKVSKTLLATRVATQGAANAAAGGLNAAAGGGSKGDIIKNAAVGAVLPEVLHQGAQLGSRVINKAGTAEARKLVTNAKTQTLLTKAKEVPKVNAVVNQEHVSQSIIAPEIKTRHIDELSVSGSKASTKIDAQKVNQYVKQIKDGEPIEPIVVHNLNGRAHVVDGQHRLAAMQKLGITDIPTVEKVPGAKPVETGTVAGAADAPTVQPVPKAPPTTKPVVSETGVMPTKESSAGSIAPGQRDELVGKQPIQAYHGTDAKFASFDDAHLGQNAAKPAALGHWFTSSEDYASGHGANIMKAKLNLDNPKTYTRAEWDNIDKNSADFTALRKELQAAGHDGIVVKGNTEQLGKHTVENPSVYAVFDSKKINLDRGDTNVGKTTGNGLASGTEADASKGLQQSSGHGSNTRPGSIADDRLHTGTKAPTVGSASTLKTATPRQAQAGIAKPPVKVAEAKPEPTTRTLKPSETAHMKEIGGYTHSEHMAQDYADMLRGQEQQATGGQMVKQVDGSYRRTSEHSRFYRDFYKEKGRAPTKADYLEQAKLELEAGKDGIGAGEDYKKLLEREAKPVPRVEVTPQVNDVPQGTSKVGDAVLEKAVGKKLKQTYGETAQYDKINIKDQAKKAVAVTNDRELLDKVISGETPLPDGLRATALIDAIQTHPELSKDVDLLLKVSKSPLASESSYSAQELRLARERAQHSPIEAIKSVRKAREAAIEKKTGKTVAEATSKEIQAIRAAKATVPKQTKETFASFVESLKC